MFFGHPAQLSAPRTLSGARLASPNASDICGIMFFAFFRAAHCAIKQRDGNCQPWFYLRLVAYGFVGLSEGAYGGPETSPLEGVGLTRRRILTLEPERSVPANRAYDNLAFRQALRAQAAFDFRCSASKDSPFFQIFNAMAAILRAKVKRAISGRIPFFSSPR